MNQKLFYHVLLRINKVKTSQNEKKEALMVVDVEFWGCFLSNLRNMNAPFSCLVLVTCVVGSNMLNLMQGHLSQFYSS
jgi:hypothetical protein